MGPIGTDAAGVGPFYLPIRAPWVGPFWRADYQDGIDVSYWAHQDSNLEPRDYESHGRAFEDYRGLPADLELPMFSARQCTAG